MGDAVSYQTDHTQGCPHVVKEVGASVCAVVWGEVVVVIDAVDRKTTVFS